MYDIIPEIIDKEVQYYLGYRYCRYLGSIKVINDYYTLSLVKLETQQRQQYTMNRFIKDFFFIWLKKKYQVKNKYLGISILIQ